MDQNIFEYIKDRITARNAAELYGYEMSHTGMMCCPFHQDTHPSAKVDTRFHCFVCGVDEDAIGFTAKLFGLSTYAAAKKLADDYGLAIPGETLERKIPTTNPKTPVKRLTREQIIEAYADSVYRVYCKYYRIISKWLLDNSLSSDPIVRKCYFEIMDLQWRVEDLLDTLAYGSAEEKAQLILKTRGKVNSLERRIIEFERGNMAGIC